MKELHVDTGMYNYWLFFYPLGFSDDRLEERAVESAVRAMASDLDIGWVYGRIVTVSDDGARISPPKQTLSSTSFRWHNELPQPGTFFSRWALDKIGFLDERFNLAMDIDLWLRFFDAGIKSVYVPNVLATFEVHDTSKSGSLTKGQFPTEAAHVFAKNNRPEAAAIAFGKAVAQRSYQGGPRPVESASKGAS